MGGQDVSSPARLGPGAAHTCAIVRKPALATRGRTEPSGQELPGDNPRGTRIFSMSSLLTFESCNLHDQQTQQDRDLLGSVDGRRTQLALHWGATGAAKHIHPDEPQR